jgi:peptide/nickel transport system substrate-binding protein
MQEQLKQAGFNIEILQVDVAELNRRYVQTNDFDIFYNGGGVFRADPSVSATYFLKQNFTPNGGNASHYFNQKVEDLYAQGQAVKDPVERKKIYTQVAQILNDEAPWIYLWSPNSLYAFTNNLHGFAPPSYSDNQLWNAETWSVSSKQ